MWVFRVTSEFVPAIFAVLSLIILGVVPKGVVLSGFSSGSFFMAMSIFGIGAVLVASGLTYRIILLMLRYMPKRQGSYWFGLLSIGVLMTPVIPSANGRSALVAPLFKDMLSTLHFARTGKAATRLAFAAFTGVSLFSSVFMTSKSANFVVFGLLPPQVQERFDWLYWLLASGVALLVFLLFSILLCKILFRNREVPRLSSEVINAQLKMLGPMNLFEWAALVSIIVLSVGIMTKPLHKIEPAWVAMILLYTLLTLGALGKKQFKERIDWSFLFLLAAMIGVVATMSHIGLDIWFARHLAWLEPYMKNNFELFVLMLSVTVVVVRLVIPNTTAIVLFSTIFVPIASSTGINPWVVVFIILTMSDAWFFRYQCSYYLLFAELAGDDRNFDSRLMFRANMLANVLRLVAIYASIPYWKALAIL